jgi:glyoxylase-like metal-dependent hydrolase (beta-lactamase superfamily II)
MPAVKSLSLETYLGKVLWMGTGVQNAGGLNHNNRIAIESIARGPITVVNTHWHFDHIGGNALFDHIGIADSEINLIERSLTNAELIRILGMGFGNSLTLPKGFVLEKYQFVGTKASFTIKDGDVFNLGNREIEAIATPGSHPR